MKLFVAAWSEIPKDRFNVDAFWAPSKNRNTSTTRGAHFLKQDISKFDANFFNFSKAEADAMDPQHRMMKEVTYEALENAGLPLSQLAGSRTGVFMGQFTSDYREMMFKDSESAPVYSATGSSKTSLANRISWLFDLKGPSFTMDTACSSSLVALHLACQSLRTGESDIAIVGGVNILLNPDMFLYLSNQNFLSPDGLCKSFDESGNGYGRGEGFAAIVLRRVHDAITFGDPIRAVIRGTASNQDGHTKGFTLPSANAQAALIEDTYRGAGLDFMDTHYFEAHVRTRN
jgi:zearalenone synthase (highly reducing iterative type I polyketide synthase)